MTVKIRAGVFETNSSSSHSINTHALQRGDLMDNTLMPNEEGILHIYGEADFGWQQVSHGDAASKATYVYVDQCTYYRAPNPVKEADVVLNEVKLRTNIDILIEVIKEQTKAKEVIFACDRTGSRKIYSYSDREDGVMGYIDHQSQGTSSVLFSGTDAGTKKRLRNFIFNPASRLELDNDNH